jgi:uncharacterized small protein (DUF1192 family)
MKKLITILVLVACVNYGYSQADSVYKYVYIFRPDVPNERFIVFMDSSFNPRDSTFGCQILTSVRGEVKDAYNKPISFPTICLDSNNKRVWCDIGRVDGTFSRALHPGNYQLIVGGVGNKSASISFSIRNQTTVHFNISLAQDASLAVYEIHSKIKLPKGKIDRIKSCVNRKKDLRGCAEKYLYYVVEQI